MEISLTGQLYVFAGAILLGVIIAILYDFFRIMRLIFNPSTAVIFIEDIIYWLIISAVVFMYFYEMNSGEIRLFPLAAVIGGAAAYFYCVSRYIIAFLKKVIYRTKKWLKKISQPISDFMKKIFSPLIFLKKQIKDFISLKKQCRIERIKIKKRLKRNEKRRAGAAKG